MIAGNLNYFYNTLGISKSSFAVNYDFSAPSGSGLNVPSVPSGNPIYSGVLSNSAGYYNLSGSGSFQNTTIQIQNSSGLAADYFTMMLVYDKPSTGNGILFSSLQSGVNISGFLIGTNDSNRLYFETYDQNGVYAITSSNIYSSKNAVAIVKSNNLLNLYYYNFNYQTVEAESFQISSTALYNSNQCYVGGTGANTPSYITQNNFSGYLSEFIYINQALTSHIIQNLFSGIYCTKNPSTTGILGYSSGAGFVTGGQAIYTGIGTGITGQQVFLAGTYLDFCGNPYPLYSFNSLTGIISGYKFFPLTGNFIFTGTGLIDQGYNINTGFANSFGMEGIAYTRNIQGDDFQELYTSPGILTKNLNNLAQFNSDGTFKLNSISSNGQINLYLNGAANFPSGYAKTGTVYVQNVVLSGDYLVSGQSVISTGFYRSTDFVQYDYISGQDEIFSYVSGTGTFAMNYPNNGLIFLNGQKLVSGLKYNIAGSNLNIIYPFPGGGFITSFVAQTGTNYYSGNFINLIAPNFGRGTSELWLNGQKELLNNDYVEISAVDLLNGSGLFSNFNNILYNNNILFMETF